MSPEQDQQLLQDFLTETGELIEQLDRDLVSLEASADAGSRSELLNSVFRALHTVKGAAGFLNLAPVAHFAHAAEDALNRLRRGEIKVTADVMDALLSSVDVLRRMAEAISSQEEIPECPAALMGRLRSIAGAPADMVPLDDDGSPSPAPDALDLDDAKRELLPYFIADLRQGTDDLHACIARWQRDGDTGTAMSRLQELAHAVEQTASFFDVAPITHVAREFRQAIGDGSAVDVVKLDQVGHDLVALADALEAGRLPSAEIGAAASTPATETDAQITDEVQSVAGQPPGAARERRIAQAAEQTVRVDVNRLEALLNLVGQLVLTKNRVVGMSRQIQACVLPAGLHEIVRESANELDRLTGELQRGVMRTRLQPMAKLFDRYPRIIRDIARSTGKQIDLRMTGRDTEVDKTVLELLSDPLVHIMRNSADHGIEAPDARRAVGKSDAGVIQLRAEHQGNHVRVEVTDDGKGLDCERIGRKAVEKGVITEEERVVMSDDQLRQLIFAPGLSTAEKLSDLSGRGVGMDVVRTNVTKMNGSVHVLSTPGKGTTVEILIPLTVAILPAMVVGVGDTLYALPLTSIVEIVRPTGTMRHSVNGRPVLTIRQTVMPLIDLRERLGHDVSTLGRFAVVVACGAQKLGLVVDQLVGQQEVVIKPLDESHAGGPFSGATIREDGGVSLILDIAMLLNGHGAAVPAPARRAA